jgi:acyl-CoA synthetase (AMP-forming)/AMP-acid ligase II
MTLLHDLLDARAESTPDAPALTRDGRTWTYRELAASSFAAAEWLRGRGIGRGDRVLLLGHNQARLVVLLFATSRLGAIFVLVSDQIRPFHLDHIRADCTPALVLRGDELDEIPDVPTERLPEQPCLSIDPSCLIYTSGSTAMPKAVMTTHRQLLFAARAIHDRLGYRTDDVVFCCLPLSFDYGLYQSFLCCLGGAHLVLGDDADAGPTLLGRLVEHDVSVLPLVPSLAVTLCRLVGRGGQAPRRLRMVTNTGADLSPARCAQLRAAVPGLAVVAMFGLTECKRVSIAEPDLDRTRPGSVGRPLPDTEVSIVDEYGRPVPPGEPGELVVRGAHVMAGYWNAPELTARRYRRDALGQPVLHTGDRCRLDADGYLYFVGRDDDVFKQRGVRVSTTEIEAAALDVPGVELAAALPPDGGHGSRLAVCGELTRAELLDGLIDRLDKQKLPDDCRVVAALPLSVNGKLDKRALAARWAERGTLAEVGT